MLKIYAFFQHFYQQKADIYLLRLAKSLHISIKKGISWMKFSLWIKMMIKNKTKIK